MSTHDRPDAAALFQAASGVMNDKFLDVANGTTKDGEEFRALIFTGDTAVDLNGDPDAVAAALSGGDPSKDQDALRAGMTLATEQQPLDRSKQGMFAREAGVMQPEFDPGKLFNIYHDDPDFRACVDARAAAVAGLGMEIRQKARKKEPDEAQRDKLAELLENISGDEPLALQIQCAHRDETVCGIGYWEVVRDYKAAQDESLRAINYARSIVTRAGRPPKGKVESDTYYQLHADRSAIFRRLGKHDKEPYALCRKLAKPSLVKNENDDWSVAIGWATADQYKDAKQAKAEGRRVGLATATESLEVNVTSDAELRATTEMTHLSILADNDSYYGLPPIINAVRDWAAARYVRLMNLNYFDNNTIPPMLVIVKGERLPTDTVNNIRTAITRNRGRDAFHKAVYIELPEGCELELRELSQLLQQDAGFMQYLDLLSKTIHRAMRTPLSMTALVEEANQGVVDNATRWYVDTVVRPDQARNEHKLNWIFRRYYGITDWEVRLGLLSLSDEKTKAEIDEIYLRGATYAPNDILRRLGMPEKDGGQFATKTVPGVGVILLEAIEEISRRVIAGESVRDVLAPRGAKTPSSEAPLIQPAGDDDDGEEGLAGLASADYVIPAEDG